MAAIDGGAPGGEGRGQKGGVIEGDSTDDGGVGGEKRVDAVLWLVMGEEDGRGLRVEMGKVNRPEVGGGRSCAGEDGGAVEGDVDGVGVESGGASMVAQEADG